MISSALVHLHALLTLLVFYSIALFPPLSSLFFFFNDPAPTEIYTLSLHDALPISLLPAIAVVSPGTGWGTMANDFPERRARMFPRLSAEQIERLSKCGERRRVARGTILFDQGDTSRNFHVVISGEMEIVHPVDGREERITVHAPGQFTGESSLLTGRPALVRGRMREDGELLEVTPAALRRGVQSDSELSQILLRAFILRRVALIANDRGDAVLIGSSHSAATLKSATPPP